MAAANKRQPPPGYPTGQNQKEEAPPVDNSIKTQEADGEDVDETDRGISARFRFGYPKPRTHGPYPGPGLVPFDDYDPAPPRGRYNHPSGYDYPPPHGHARPGFQPHVSYEVSDEEDEVDYEGGYGHQAIRRPQQYNERQTYVDEEEVDYEGGYGHQAIPRPQRYYERQTYVAEQPPPPPPPPRRPVYPPQGNYYVRDEYERY